MQTAQLEDWLSPEDYLAREENAEQRHEYVDGQIYAMSGGSLRHNRIALNISSKLMQHLDGTRCQTYMNDVKLHIAASSSYYYPDVLVNCQRETQADAAAQVSDAQLIIEVLSPSTETTDRREKLSAYRKLAGLQEYVLICQTEQKVEVYRRQSPSAWLYIVYEAGDLIELESVKIQMAISDLYRGTDLALSGR